MQNELTLPQRFEDPDSAGRADAISAAMMLHAESETVSYIW
jgi:hypothetical protein